MRNPTTRRNWADANRLMALSFITRFGTANDSSQSEGFKLLSLKRTH
jgi:hypothetical protein